MSSVAAGGLEPSEVLVAQGRVFYALMLRDIRTRFGGSALGFLLSIAWPLSHILILVAINTAIGRLPPYGNSAALWFATGVAPFMVINYLSRFTMLGVLVNKNVLLMPSISTSDILFARAIVEVLSSTLVVLILITIFFVSDIDFYPIDVVVVGSGMAAAALLGLGLGVLNGVIAAFLPFWATAFALFQLLLWLASGVLFVPDALPASIQYYLAFNPALGCVEWVRSGYYLGYGAHLADKPYVVTWGLGTLLIGLILERLLRGRILIS